MISYLRGTLIENTIEYTVLEVGGIGYKVLTPATVALSLNQTGSEIKLFTYLHVREDILQLYGFLQKEDLSSFELLLSVSGIGPKGALAILSFLSSERLYSAILNEDIGLLSKVPGIGKKTAQRMVLELKDKVKKLSTGTEVAGKEVPSLCEEFEDDAIEALIALGYQRNEAVKAVGKAKGLEYKNSQDLIKGALKELARF